VIEAQSQIQFDRGGNFIFLFANILSRLWFIWFNCWLKHKVKYNLIVVVGTFVLICTYIEQIQNCASYGLYDLVAVCKVILTINST